MTRPAAAPPPAAAPSAAGPPAAGPPAAAPPAAAPPRPPSRWRRNWYRLVVPFTVLGLLIGVTLLARGIEDPDLADQATLFPTGTGRDGSSELAELLAAQGVRIEQVETLDEAERALRFGGDAVVFVPKPTVTGAWLTQLTGFARGDHRVVLVAPDPHQLLIAGLSVVTGPQRWASRAVSPGPACRIPEATATGTATVLRNRYLAGEDGDTCYRGGLVRVSSLGTEVFVVGASDPFRNGRIHEHGNAQLAVELLAARDRVIWAGALPAEADLEVPSFSRPPVDRNPGNPFEPLLTGYPPGVLAALVLFALLAVLVAVVSGRRLGPPVREPLPVLVPAAEAVAGRGRLYQRVRGHAVALSALRAAALAKLVRALDLPAAPPPEPATVVAAAAQRAGLPAERVHHTLYGPDPLTEAALADAVAALDALVAAVTRDNPTGRMVP